MGDVATTSQCVGFGALNRGGLVGLMMPAGNQEADERPETPSNRESLSFEIWLWGTI